jgi:hypothetical protein
MLTMLQSNSLTDKAQGHFKPYVSALSNFKAYRYHPTFSAEVEAGIRSLTYSHNIDPNKELCWFEAQGGICNDPECDDQHFREIEVGGMYSFPLIRLNKPKSLLYHLLCRSFPHNHVYRLTPFFMNVDDEILRQIGADNPGRTKEEREEYKKGLREVIEDLRSRNLEGQQAVMTTAETILEYRRSYLKDPSRVLNI